MYAELACSLDAQPGATQDSLGCTLRSLREAPQEYELSYIVGQLGRGRACLLRRGEVEIPSDLSGVIYTDLDPAEGWKLKLVRELKAAELDFDANQTWA
jgi:Predicted nucleotide-binding protein containing TIR-like domain